ncbi:hypothetical protein [Mesorhizobium sp. BE184]|uniref:hypothetical protein n=1 Tax=Mesorhizobium sp. BE184 TaxID=2817714 RepID=UPI002860A757|nr:hypothetical protein [Mesorhizobium sp. BE184]MDR7034511.1 hypothetical protein [Mesorhizobium sp. BE184]
MTPIVSLSQAELDDAYHRAYFECEAAAIAAVCRVLPWEDDRATRDLLINRIAQDLHEVEASHLGPDRYTALMDRLVAKLSEGIDGARPQ